MLSTIKSNAMVPKMMTNFCQRVTSGLLVTPSHSAFALPQIRHMDSLYQADSCEDCTDSYPMLAMRSDITRLKKPDTSKVPKACWHALRRTEYKCRTDPEFSVSAFIDHNRNCVLGKCASEMPLSDLTHYKPSDKLNRKYQRTWVECVLKRRKVKARCYFKPIPTERRKRKVAHPKLRKSSCDKSPSTFGVPDLRLTECLKKPPRPCPRFEMPFCKPVRDPPKCNKGDRKRVSCHRRLTKYPSFSECLIDPLPDIAPTECNCLKTPSMCSVWEYYRNKKS